MKYREFYRDLSRLTHFRAEVFRGEKPGGISVSVGRGDPGGASPSHLVLNRKVTKRVGGGHYASTSRLIMDGPPEALFGEWPLWQRRPIRPSDALAEITFEVEDASPDSTLGVILVLARLAGCDLARFPGRWVDAAESWEKTGIVEDPRTSWAALCSALAHKHFPIATHAGHENYERAWLDTIRFTSGCLARAANPFKLDPMGDWDLWRDAAVAEDQEEQAYHDWLVHAEILQLSLPLKGGEGRRLLVDALLVAEDEVTGTAKVFYRNDSVNAPLKHGFSLGAHYRPNELKGDGNDFTISVDPRRGVELRELWEELERRECAAWQAEREERPSDKPRELVSVDSHYNQPWYLDAEETLIGAPMALCDGRLGSKLDWDDVCAAIWTTYNPLKNVRVIDRSTDVTESSAPVLLAELKPVVFERGVEKRLFLASWPHDRKDPVLKSAPRALNLSETAARYLATITRHPAPGRAAPESISLRDLVPPGAWQRVDLSGGLAIVSDDGVLVLDDWRREVSLNLPILKDDESGERDRRGCERPGKGHARCAAAVAAAATGRRGGGDHGPLVGPAWSHRRDLESQRCSNSP